MREREREREKETEKKKKKKRTAKNKEYFVVRDYVIICTVKLTKRRYDYWWESRTTLIYILFPRKCYALCVTDSPLTQTPSVSC